VSSAEVETQSFSFKKTRRLLTSGEFGAVFDDAKFKASHSHFLILAIPNQLDSPRLGLVIAKKNVRCANERNRLKRLVRESFRLKQHNLPAIDAIVLARRSSGDADNPTITDTLDALWKRVAQRANKQK